MLKPSDTALVQHHDVIMLDLDGVVYADGHAIAGAVDGLAAARETGTVLAFITNNASRTPEAVAEHLSSLGIPAAAEDVVTSAQAAAGVLSREHPPGARVLALGGEGLCQALAARGLVPVRDMQAEDVAALATGYGPDVVWRDVMAAATRIRDGLPWIATNTDWTIPTAAGVAPGHGVLVRMLSDFAGVVPAVAGKPARPLLEETIQRTGARTPLMVGDRMDTDIEGAAAVGVASLLVLTGVTDLEALVAAPPAGRPDHLSTTLQGLLSPHGAPRAVDGRWELGGWRAVVVDGVLHVDGTGNPDDWWRSAAAAAWQHLDRVGRSVSTQGLRPPPAADVGADR